MSFSQTYEDALEKARNRPPRPRKAISRGKGFQAKPAAIGLKRAQVRPATAARRKAKTKKRTKMPSRKSLVKKIDGLVFQIICLMYAACVECGSVDKPTTGHVLSRRSYSTRWSFQNVFRQCWPCNYRAAMTAAASYHAWFVRTYGAEAFEHLYRDWTTGRKYTRLELQNLLPEYQARLESLKEQK